MSFNPKLPLFAGAVVEGRRVALRLVESDGRVLSDVACDLLPYGRGIAGLLESVKAAVITALRTAELGESLAARTWVGMGLPHERVGEAVARLREDAFGFAGAAVAADLHVRCLGAHQGPDGGLIEVDTHCRAIALPRNLPRRLGGGWPLADAGGLAAIGRATVADTLDVIDGLAAADTLTDQVAARFGDRDGLMEWIAAADAEGVAAVGSLALALDGDSPRATALLDRAADRVAALADRLEALGARSVVLTGSLAEVLARRAGRDRFVEAHGDGSDGALTLVRRMTSPLSPH
ncbi:MAG: hypothetical protein RLO50_06880 [Azospirillaceae bacterium]